MGYQSSYELTELADDRIKDIHREVKQMGGVGESGAQQMGDAGESGSIVLRRMLPAAVVLGAALSLILGQ